MSRKKVDSRPSDRKAKPGSSSAESSPQDAGRRKFVLLGVGALATTGVGLAAAYNAGWFDSRPAPAGSSAAPVGKGLPPATLAASAENARRAVDEMLEYYARDLGNASVLIHAVRGFGRNFTMADGRNAVDHLLGQYAAEKEVAGKRYVYFKREAEVHENSFLKTFLEAGVGLDKSFAVGGNRHTLRDAAESAKALFRFDPQDLYRYDADQYRYDPTPMPARRGPNGEPMNQRGELVHEHLPWGLIAFSIMLPPAQSAWTNAYGEKLDLAAVLDRGLAEYESTCLLTRDALRQGQRETEAFRQEIKKYSCFGLHSVYGFLAGLKHGYRNNNLETRLQELMDVVIYRLKGDAEMIDQEYAAANSQPLPPQMIATLARYGLNQAQVAEALRLRAQIKMFGHAFEAINYARLHKLIAFTPEQERRIQAGEAAFHDTAVRMRAQNLGGLRQWDAKIVSDIVIALGHAARALKLLNSGNPDVAA
ncbi:MAG: hypothetical protein SF339_12400 [Blastocatellia bacterium]|nr:hypothetical protein [Blastocatellia bacterium]